MDIEKWLRNTASHAEPQDDPIGSHGKLTTSPKYAQHMSSKVRHFSMQQQQQQRGRSQARESSILQPAPSRGSVVPDRSPAVVDTSYKFMSDQPGVTQESEHADRKYERRPRRKTRIELYEPGDRKSRHQRKRKTQRAHASPARSRHEARGRRSRRRGTTTRSLADQFEAQNVPTKRLTLKPKSRLGLFCRGRASNPIQGRGVSDLAFSEMKFLSKRQASEDHEPGDQPASKSRKREEGCVGNKEISDYFAAHGQAPLQERHGNIRPNIDFVRREHDQVSLEQGLRRASPAQLADAAGDVQARDIMQPQTFGIQRTVSSNETRRGRMQVAENQDGQPRQEFDRLISSRHTHGDQNSTPAVETTPQTNSAVGTQWSANTDAVYHRLRAQAARHLRGDVPEPPRRSNNHSETLQPRSWQRSLQDHSIDPEGTPCSPGGVAGRGYHAPVNAPQLVQGTALFTAHPQKLVSEYGVTQREPTSPLQRRDMSGSESVRDYEFPFGEVMNDCSTAPVRATPDFSAPGVPLQELRDVEKSPYVRGARHSISQSRVRKSIPLPQPDAWSQPIEQADIIQAAERPHTFADSRFIKQPDRKTNMLNFEDLDVGVGRVSEDAQDMTIFQDENALPTMMQNGDGNEGNEPQKTYPDIFTGFWQPNILY